MTDQQYLQQVLINQELADDSQEVEDLERHRSHVSRLLKAEFGPGPTLTEGGSKAKGTMIKEAYDLDLPYYFPRDDDSAGDTIKEIYETVDEALRKSYRTARKGVAVRLLDCEEGTDFHVDVIPGRFIDGESGDAFLYPSSTDKERLQTNLETHIKHVRDSGVRDAIRLMKLWKTRRELPVKTFALELLTIDLLRGRRNANLPDQLIHVWTEFRDNMDNLSIEDPANSNNDLSGMLDNTVRSRLSATAADTLRAVEEEGWPAVFGQVETEANATDRALHRIALATAAPAKPWCSGS